MRIMLIIWLIISLCSVFAKAPLLWRMRGDFQQKSIRYLFAEVAGKLLFDIAVVIVAVRVLLSVDPDASPSFNLIILTVAHLVMTVLATLFAGYMLNLFGNEAKESESHA